MARAGDGPEVATGSFRHEPAHRGPDTDDGRSHSFAGDADGRAGAGNHVGAGAGELAASVVMVGRRSAADTACSAGVEYGSSGTVIARFGIGARPGSHASTGVSAGGAEARDRRAGGAGVQSGLGR